jgi:hypothetical protein
MYTLLISGVLNEDFVISLSHSRRIPELWSLIIIIIIKIKFVLRRVALVRTDVSKELNAPSSG